MSRQNNETSKQSPPPKLQSKPNDISSFVESLNGNDIASINTLLEDKRALEDDLGQKKKEIEVKDEECKVFKSEGQNNLEEGQTLAAKLYQIDSAQKYIESEIMQLEEERLQEIEKTKLAEQKLQDAERQLQQIQEDLDDTKARWESDKTLLHKTKMQLAGTTQELESQEETLEKERKRLGFKSFNYERLANHFTDFARRYHEFAKKFFLGPIPEDLKAKPLPPSLLPYAFLTQAPFSNSPSQSQYHRVAMAESFIAEILCARVFRLYYLPSDDLSRLAIDRILKRLHAESPRKEAIMRLQLLSAYSVAEQKHQLRKDIDLSLKDIVSGLKGSILRPSTPRDMKRELRILFQEAANLWRPFQSCEIEPEVDMHPDVRNQNGLLDWETYADFDLQLPGNASHLAVTSLFPRILLGERVISRGYMLRVRQDSMIRSSECECRQRGTCSLATAATGEE